VEEGFKVLATIVGGSETFRSTLSIAAEVRRHVAAKRLEVLGEIVRRARELDILIGFGDRSQPGTPSALNEMKTRNAALDEFNDYMTKNSHVLSRKITDAFGAFTGKLFAYDHASRSTIARPGAADDFEAYRGAFTEIVTLARAELLVDDQPQAKDAARAVVR
jgi:hypothetical protein